MQNIYKVLEDTHSSEYWYIKQLEIDTFSSVCLENLHDYVEDLGFDTINDLLRFNAVVTNDEISIKALKKYEQYRLEYGV